MNIEELIKRAREEEEEILNATLCFKGEYTREQFIQSIRVIKKQLLEAREDFADYSSLHGASNTMIGEIMGNMVEFVQGAISEVPHDKVLDEMSLDELKEVFKIIHKDNAIFQVRTKWLSMIMSKKIKEMEQN